MILTSVIIVTYNVSRYIQSAIESILNQSKHNFEVIIIDDGSTDSTNVILDYYENLENFVVIKRSHTGNVGKLRNEAIKLSKGELIAILDGDDVWNLNKHSKQINYIKDFDLVCSNAFVIDENEKIIDKSYLKINNEHLNLDLKSLLKFNNVITSSVLMRKSSCINAGLFEDNIGFRGEDYLLWLNISKVGKIKFINEPLLKYRRHPMNLGVHPQFVDFETLNERNELLLRTSEIRKAFFYYKDPIVVQSAKEGCVSIFIELVQLNFKAKNYQKALKFCRELLLVQDKKKYIKYFKYRLYFFIIKVICIFYK